MNQILRAANDDGREKKIDGIKKLLDRSIIAFVDIFEAVSEGIGLGYFSKEDLPHIFGRNEIWWNKIHALGFLTQSSRDVVRCANYSGRKIGLEAAVMISRIRSERAQEKIARCAALNRYITRQQVIDCVDEFREGKKIFKAPKGMENQFNSQQEEISLEEFCFMTAEDRRTEKSYSRGSKNQTSKKETVFEEGKGTTLKREAVSKKKWDALGDSQKEALVNFKKMAKNYYKHHYLDLSDAVVRCLEKEGIDEKLLLHNPKKTQKWLRELLSLKNIKERVRKKIRETMKHGSPLLYLDVAVMIATLPSEVEQNDVVEFCIRHELRRRNDVEKILKKLNM